jgi:hypothetical protein
MIKYTAKLGVYSEKLSAGEINDILDITYDKYWIKGMPCSKRSDVMKFEQHAWFIVSDIPNDVPLDRQIINILERIEPSIDKFAQLYDECEIYFNCTIEGDENPELHLSSELIQLMSNIKASFDVDIFISQRD